MPVSDPGVSSLPRVRVAVHDDAASIADIHRQAFVRQRDSDVWVRSTLSASPRMMVFVLLLDAQVVGYAFWAQKSGFRPAAIIELDQIAVASAHRGKGLGAMLLRESLAQVTAMLGRTGQTLHAVLVSTSADNPARRLYEQTLGATGVATIEGLFSAPEVLMMAQPGQETDR